MEAAYQRVGRLAEAGLVRVKRRGLKTVPEFEHVSGRVHFGPCGASDCAHYAQVSIDGVATPASYVLGAPQRSSASLSAGYEHFLALCSSLDLLGSDFQGLAVEPNRPATRGSVARWSNRRALGFALRHRSTEDGGPARTAIAALDCSGYEEFELARLLTPGVFESRADAAQWLAEEIRDAFADGEEARAYGYVTLMGQPVMAPVVLCADSEGGLVIWDGWHRVAASLCRGAKVIRAVVVRAGGRIEGAAQAG